MTVAGLLNRLVSIEHRTADVEDEHGNTTTATTGWSANVRARRELLSTTERATFGDFSATVYVYVFDAGTTVGRLDRIHDGEVYEVRGEPDEVEGRSVVHHYEVIAERISG